MKRFECPDGELYIKTGDNAIDVDDLIEFLEQYKGKRFYNGATETLSFYVTDSFISCDELDYFLKMIDDDDLHNDVYESIPA